jgi:hypothetical protein
VELIELLSALLATNAQQHFLATRMQLQKFGHIIHLRKRASVTDGSSKKKEYVSEE